MSGRDATPATAPVAIHGSAIKSSPPDPEPENSIGMLVPSRPEPTIQVTVAPQTTTAPPTQAPPPPVKPTNSKPWRNCIEARIHGRCIILSGDPDYSAKLDRDKDGVACEC